ncbi:hypothetical protein PA598K_03290 [Paenibacillus sp. 598K]|nr:hypothetical protein PA598K_03290 [Paenibacillus sp. 598K]
MDQTFDYLKKNKRKRVRTVLQLALLLALGYLVIHAVFDIETYREPARPQWTSDKGFVALSYFGVSRSGTPTLIAKDRLEQHLQALYDHGYTSIAQQDILDYYKQGKPLPERGLFLSFGDGRNDSSLFAQPFMERYNFKATMLSYANKMDGKDSKFLTPKELLKMTRKGYWELGSNGYRLTYINIHDEDGRFIGLRDEGEFPEIDWARSYTHYLMDFLRDGDGIPTEDKTEMDERITYDYNEMERIYKSTLGDVPSTYMIMHANTMYNGMNHLVEKVNARHIPRLFDMHFNREGSAFNGAGGELYNLTRLQPAPYWYTNHLLMKLREDTGDAMQFIVGDTKRAEDWQLLEGAAEHIDNRIALTSTPGGPGRLYLTGHESEGDVQVKARLSGTVVGQQSVYVIYDRERAAYVQVKLADNVLHVIAKQPGQEAKTVWTHEFPGLEKNRQYPPGMMQQRSLEATLRGERLTVNMDGVVLSEGIEVGEAAASGGVLLESEASPLNKKDTIYDGVFDNVEVRTIRADGSVGKAIYDNRLRGVELVVAKVRGAVNHAVDWAIETF